MTIVTVNAGSSSIRLEAFADASGELKSLGRVIAPAGEPALLIERLIAESGLGLDQPLTFVHRWVHGGPDVAAPAIIDARVEAALLQALPLAPLHNSMSLQWIKAVREHFGAEARQIAAPDTAYYKELPDVAARYALPHEFCAKRGIRRYGFHGLAHQSMHEQWAARSRRQGGGGKVISLQLGSGCSITAILDGAPIDTSMGFTPLEGLVMATRPGDVDPGLLVYLQREAGLGVDQLEELLYHRSGLLGLSGLSGDMRDLLASEAPEARSTVALYCYRAKKYVGAYLAALGGADAILFGGGVGENSPKIRATILDGMEWCGLKLDPAANHAPAEPYGRISAHDSLIEIAVVKVDEARVMARAAADLLKRASMQPAREASR
jgi:acetate kinase